LAAAGGVDHERDRPRDRVDRLEDDRPVWSLAAVDGAAVKRAAVDLADRAPVGLREVVVSGGLDGAAEHLADRPSP